MMQIMNGADNAPINQSSHAERSTPTLGRASLYTAVLGSAAFVAGVLVEAASRPGYSSWRHAVSQLSLGPGWQVNVVLLLVEAMTLLALAHGIRRSSPGGRRTAGLLALAGVAMALLAVFPINPALGYPPGAPAAYHWQGLVHAAAGTAWFGLMAAAALSVGGPAGAWRRASRWTGILIAGAYVATVTLTSLDQAGLWPNSPGGLAERVAMLAIVAWSVAAAVRALDRAPASN